MSPGVSLLKRLRSLSLSAQIAIALSAGTILGLFLGEIVAPISVIADGYILLLQMTVLPYITVSLVAGLGSLTPNQARMIFSNAQPHVPRWCIARDMLHWMP